MTALPFLADAIERRPIETLLPYAANARLHDEAQVARLAASLIEYGWLVPCLVDDQGVLVAGHGRLLAARHLGLAEAPVIRASHLTDAQARAFRIADNKLTELGGWDDGLLAAELARLREEDYDLDLLGFDAAEIEDLLAGLDAPEGPADGDPDTAPEPPADPVTKPGDLWLLGTHRLLCGDATVLANIEKVLGGSLADMCFCDPPYNVSYAGGAGARKDRRILNDALGEGFRQFLSAEEVGAHHRRERLFVLGLADAPGLLWPAVQRGQPDGDPPGFDRFRQRPAGGLQGAGHRQSGRDPRPATGRPGETDYRIPGGRRAPAPPRRAAPPGAACPWEFDIHLVTTGGYLPRARVRTQGGGASFKVGALGLEPGETFKVKAGFRLFSGMAEHILTVA